MYTSKRQVKMQIVGMLRGLGFTLAGAGLAAAVAASGYQMAIGQRMLPQVQIAGQPVGGMNQTQALRRAQSTAPDLARLPIRVIYGSSQWETTAAEAGFSYDFTSAVQQAYSIGHQGGPLASFTAQLDLLRQPAVIPIQLHEDQGRLNSWVDGIASRIDRPLQNAGLKVSGASVIVVPGQSGLIVNRPALVQAMAASVKAGGGGSIVLPVDEDPQTRTGPALADAAARLRNLLAEAPLTIHLGDQKWQIDSGTLHGLIRWQLPPAPATALDVTLDTSSLSPQIEQIARQVNGPSVDAQLGWVNGGLVVLKPSQEGRQVDVDGTLAAIRNAIESPNRDANLVVKTTQPLVSSADLPALGIKEAVSEGDSNFSFSSSDRIVNVRKMAGLLNGVTLAPGEEFSFNKVMGDISPEAGWAEGLVINDGRTVPGLGGGICQVSTTAFRAAFWAGLPITERHDHAYPVPYYTQGGYPEGFDATVWSPQLDLKFVNDTGHYLLIQTAVDLTNDNLKVIFYGTKPAGRKVTMEGPFISNVQPAPPAKHITDPSKPKGYVEQTDYSHAGMNVLIRRVVEDGVSTRTDEFSSNYQPWAAVYVEGPKAAPDTPKSDAAKTPSATQPA